jgi:phosphatidylglycerol:prolipoprotein diacylglycerol transferase
MLASWKAKQTGQDPDTYFDLAVIAIICSLIGARIYYVVFRWDIYKGDLLSILNIRQGGLAIYGGVIAAILTTYIFSRVKKIPYGRLCDTAGLGLILGQIIGRWGNFFNREAFGGYTDNLLAMQLPVSSVRAEDLTEELLNHTVLIDGVTYVQVHPTFLYESLWNVMILILLLVFFNKRSFEGEVFLWYLLGYGIGRFWIESLRTDQLLLPGIGYPVSRVVAVLLAAVAVAGIAVGRTRALRKQR